MKDGVIVFRGQITQTQESKDQFPKLKSYVRQLHCLQSKEGCFYATEKDTIVLHIDPVFGFLNDNQITQDNLMLIYSKIEVETMKKELDLKVRQKLRDIMHAKFVKKYMEKQQQ